MCKALLPKNVAFLVELGEVDVYKTQSSLEDDDDGTAANSVSLHATVLCCQFHL